MKISRTVTIAAAALLALSLGACRKKHASGTTDGMNGDGDRVESSPERVAAPDMPLSKPMDDGIDESGIGGPLADVYFDFDRYDVRADQRPSLERNSAWLLSNVGQNVVLEGHCDERGTEEYNLHLGDRRANSVKSYLVTLGIASNRLQTISYGKAYPVDPGHHEGAWTKNRRVHSTLAPPRASAH